MTIFELLAAATGTRVIATSIGKCLLALRVLLCVPAHDFGGGAIAAQQVQPEVHVRPNKASRYAVFANVLSSTRRLGLTRIAVIGGGEPASVALHGKMRFEHAGRMRSVGRKFGRWLDSVYMQIALGEGDSSAPKREPGERLTQQK